MHGVCPRTAAFGRFQYSLGAMSFSSATGQQDQRRNFKMFQW
jgi:hypothetical protein